MLFTLAAIQDPAYKVPLSLMSAWQNVGVERISVQRFRLNLKVPYAFFENTIRNLKIVPRHIFENIPPENLSSSDVNLRPVGNGFYKFDRLEKDSKGLIKSYYLSLADSHINTAFIDKLVFKFFINSSEAIESFNRRQVNSVVMLGANYDNIKASKKIISYDTQQYYAVFYCE